MLERFIHKSLMPFIQMLYMCEYFCLSTTDAVITYAPT